MDFFNNIGSSITNLQMSLDKVALSKRKFLGFYLEKFAFLNS